MSGRGWVPPNAHALTLLHLYTDVYTEQEFTRRDLKMNKTMAATENPRTNAQHFISFSVTVCTHTSVPLLWGPRLRTPLTLFKVPRGSSLPLEQESDSLIRLWQSQRPLLPGRSKPTGGKDCLDCYCCFKGVFVQKCSFYDCYYNYCYDYLIKDLYHTVKRAGMTLLLCLSLVVIPAVLMDSITHKLWTKVLLLIATRIHTNSCCACVSAAHTHS